MAYWARFKLAIQIPNNFVRRTDFGVRIPNISENLSREKDVSMPLPRLKNGYSIGVIDLRQKGKKIQLI